MDFEESAFSQTFVRNCFVHKESNKHGKRVVAAIDDARGLVFEAPRGFGQSASWVSKNYLTNFKTHVEQNVKPEVIKLIKRACSRHGEEKHMGYALSNYVLQPVVTHARERALHEIKSSVVLKTVLELHGMVQDSIKYYEKSGETIYYMPFNKKLELMAYVQARNTRMGLKNFSLAPIHNVKRHFVNIDADVYASFIFPRQKEAGMYARGASIAGVKKEHMWSMLNLAKLKPGCWSRENTFITDGVALCVPFTKEQADPPGADLPSEPQGKRQYVGVDPGRVNIYTTAWYEHGKVRFMKLHRSRYYKEAGMTESRAKKERWMRPIKDVVQALALTTKRTSNEHAFRSYCAALLSNYDALWDVLGAKRFSSDRMDVYSKKRKALDAFIKEVKVATGCARGARELVFAYGDARFAPCGRGSPSVPTTAAFKRMQLAARTELVDEYKTTKMDAFSFQVLSDVHDPGDNRVVARGSKCCGHNIDLELFARGRHAQGAEFVMHADGPKIVMSRDGNAALNIRNILARGVRPRALRRPSQKDKTYNMQ